MPAGSSGSSRRSAPTSRSSCSATASVAGSPRASPTIDPSGCATSSCSTRSATPSPSPPADWQGGRSGSASTAVRSLFDALRPTDDLATIGQMQRTLLANLRRHPFTVLQAAQAALTADLRTEMAVLAARGLPVLVLWSDGDRLIPLAAFDTFCSTFGTDGHVVRGGHSWLLANPDVFGEVLDNVIHVEGPRARRAGGDDERRRGASPAGDDLAAADDGAPAAGRRVAAVGAERGPGGAGRRPRPVPSPGPPRRGACRRPPAAGRRPVPADGGRPGPSRPPGRHHRRPGDRRRVRGRARR